jgi:acetolactate synthase-1/2/3 large subunit
MSTLGQPPTSSPGVADANMDRAPIVAIAGQTTTRLHKESHQILDLVNLFRPITVQRRSDEHHRRSCARHSRSRDQKPGGASSISREHRGNAVRRKAHPGADRLFARAAKAKVEYAAKLINQAKNLSSSPATA